MGMGLGMAPGMEAVQGLGMKMDMGMGICMVLGIGVDLGMGMCWLWGLGIGMGSDGNEGGIGNGQVVEVGIDMRWLFEPVGPTRLTNFNFPKWKMLMKVYV